MNLAGINTRQDSVMTCFSISLPRHRCTSAPRSQVSCGSVPSITSISASLCRCGLCGTGTYHGEILCARKCWLPFIMSLSVRATTSGSPCCFFPGLVYKIYLPYFVSAILHTPFKSYLNLDIPGQAYRQFFPNKNYFVSLILRPGRVAANATCINKQGLSTLRNVIGQCGRPRGTQTAVGTLTICFSSSLPIRISATDPNLPKSSVSELRKNRISSNACVCGLC